MFVNLYAKSDYSLLESPTKPEQLARQAAVLGMDTMALTDHNSMGSAFAWNQACLQEGIRPIFGLELDIAVPNASITPRVVLLAKTTEGYRNLLQLASRNEPADSEALAQCASGLVALSPQRHGDIAYLVNHGQAAAARTRCTWYREVFGENDFFVLVETAHPSKSRATGDEIRTVLPSVKLAIGPLAAAVSADQRPALRVLRALRDNLAWDEASPLESLMRSPDDIADQFGDLPEALGNTCSIAQRCQVVLEFGSALPSPPDPVNLRDAAFRGLTARGCTAVAAKERLNAELAVIESLGFSNYFLIVADIVQYARRVGIPVGPGRGSAAASMTAYCLDITDINPLTHGLIFERFLNPHRKGFPDIDLDFCQERRAELFDYVRERYGALHTAQIGTYSTFGLRAAVRETARIRSVPADKFERVLQAGDSFDDLEVQRALEDCPELAEVVGQLIGVRRHFSTHAAGVIITPRPTVHYTSVRPGEPLAVTHAPMDCLEGMGLLKIDFLGLRTLTLLRRIEQDIQTRKPAFDLKAIPHDDIETYALLASGASAGLFQLESSLFQELLRDLRPKGFGDIVALLALGRPGPLAYVPDYVKRRDGEAVFSYAHPVLESILQETQGLMVYQEQVMAIAHRLGGLSLTEADELRRAMSKKDRPRLAVFRSSFVQGCTAHGVDKNTADRLFSDMEKFAEYAFNKAHSTAYAEVTYRTAFLKTNYPQLFMVHSLNLAPSDERHRQYLWECLRLGLRVLPPDIRYAGRDYQPEGESGIRVGFACLKGLGGATADTICAERDRAAFSSLSDFQRRIGLSNALLETLILAGVFDGFAKRERLLQAVKPDTPPPSPRQLLDKEKALIGLYVSEHPAQRWQTFLEKLDHGFSALVCGEIMDVDRRHRWAHVLGSAGVVRIFPGNSGGNPLQRLQTGSLMAVFGEACGQKQFRVQWTLPLLPMLLISPEKEQFDEVQRILRTQSGPHPVILSLGQGMLQFLPEEYWCGQSAEVAAGLEQKRIPFQWVDPLGYL